MKLLWSPGTLSVPVAQPRANVGSTSSSVPAPLRRAALVGSSLRIPRQTSAMTSAPPPSMSAMGLKATRWASPTNPSNMPEATA